MPRSDFGQQFIEMIEDIVDQRIQRVFSGFRGGSGRQSRDDEEPGGQGRVRDPEHDRRLKENRGRDDDERHSRN